VVASAINGIPEVIRDGETGVLVPCDDAAALAAALARLLDRPEEATRLGACGQALVERRHPWPEIAREYLGLCVEVAAAHNRVAA